MPDARYTGISVCILCQCIPSCKPLLLFPLLPRVQPNTISRPPALLSPVRFMEVALASDGDLPEVTDGELVYIEQIHTTREYELTTLYVDYRRILQKDDVLADAIQKQYYRFLPCLHRALLNLVTEYEPDYLKISTRRLR